MASPERSEQAAHVRFGFGDTLEDKVAAAMYEVHVKEAEAEALTHSIPTDKIVAAFTEAIDSSDRTAAIVIFSLIDDLMIGFISKNLNPQIRGGLDILFERNGILANASSRITMAAALYWIGKESYQNLNLLRHIRNRFAHHVDVSSFEEQVIRGFLSSISPVEKEHYDKPVMMFRPYDSLSVREVFLLRSACVVLNLCQDFLRLPSARAHRVEPRHLFMVTFDEAPELMKSLYRAIVRVMISVAGDVTAFEESRQARPSASLDDRDDG